jgi:hypothetical protein
LGVLLRLPPARPFPPIHQLTPCRRSRPTPVNNSLLVRLLIPQNMNCSTPG